MQAKHANVCSCFLFWTACTRHPHVLSLPYRRVKSDSWRQAGSDYSTKMSWTVENMVTWHWILYKWRRSNKGWLFITHFSIYSTSRCRCHAGTDIPKLRGHTLQISHVVLTLRHWTSGCTPNIHWKCDERMQNTQIKSPPAVWKPLPSECLWVTLALNGKSASVLLELTIN